MIKSATLGKSYETKEELFKALRENKKEIISLKKAQILKSCDKGSSVTARPLDPLKLSTQTKNIVVDKDYWYVAVNSTRVLDSHDDLHLDGIWDRTKEQQQGKNYLVLDHTVSINTTVVRKEHIEMFTAILPFSLLGKSYEGETEVFIYKFKKDKVKNQAAKEWLESGDAIEGSVRMQYVTIKLAMNSDDKEDVEEKAVYDNHYGIIANKSDFEEIPYFFAVSEAKNITESSLVVQGSNHVTGPFEPKEQAASQAPDKIEAASQALPLSIFNYL